MAESPHTDPHNPPHVLVIGAGPAGLTAAYELGKRKVPVTVVEGDSVVGGISRTAEREGWRFDIGGHRFFTKVPEVEALWHEILPADDFIMRPRMSRIVYNGKLYDYPLRATNALRNLGPWQAFLCILSYVWVRIHPPKDQTKLEGWVAARFGWRLYRIFFKTYSEKVWGVPCNEVEADWAAQRIKNLSLLKAITNAVLPKRNQKNIASLIEEFQYPKYGPGMMWETAADIVRTQGNTIVLEEKVKTVHHANGRATGLTTVVTGGYGAGAGAKESHRTDIGSEIHYDADEIISTMAFSSLIKAMDPPAPAEVLTAANSLHYRDFLTVALVVPESAGFPDNWIYIHSPEVKVGRIQNFGSWSPYLVKEGRTCLGLEYFVFEGDETWCLPDDELVALAKKELAHLGLVQADQVERGFVVRMPKAYPYYDAAYKRNVETMRRWLEQNAPNVHPVGRNGMFRYNNQDHSMFTALLTVENITEGAHHDVWEVNVEDDYHEEVARIRDVLGGRTEGGQGSLTVTGVASPPAETAPAERSRRWRDPLFVGKLWKISLGVLLVVGVAFRFYSHSALWLDEAQSVAIAKLPLHGHGPTLIDGLRQDGSPPLYYLILHGWISLFGSSAEAVRALSAVISLIAVPPLYVLAKRVVGTRAARVTIVFYLASPFAIRFASETRMYSLVLLLSVLFGLALERTLRRPSWQSVVSMALTTGLLALTHYWTLYLLLTVGIWVVIRSFHGPAQHRRPARLAVLGLLCGFIVFLPWLSVFRYQSKHTGTPWGDPASLAAVVHAYGEWAGGSSVSGRLGLIIVASLIALALFGSGLGPRQILLDLRGHQPGKMLFFLATGTLVVAVIAGQVFNTAYADRYTAVAFVPFLLLTAVGTLSLSSPQLFRGMVALVAVFGLINGSQYVFNDRTQARQVADFLRARAGHGDVVLFCPDQLGPGVTRLAPSWLRMLAVPTLGPADRVDWVDYAKRNESADGKAIADKALAMAGTSNNIWLVESDKYKTYDTLCPAVQFELQTKRPHAVAQVTPRDKVYEHEALIWFLRH